MSCLQGIEVTAVGFEPTPLRTGALSQRLRPLGQTVLFAFDAILWMRAMTYAGHRATGTSGVLIFRFLALHLSIFDAGSEYDVLRCGGSVLASLAQAPIKTNPT